MDGLRTRVLAVVVLALAPWGGASGQTAFPHAAHDPLFPLCAGCHTLDAGPAAVYPPSDLCGRCHDGEQAPRVRWSPPAGGDAYGHAAHGPASATPLECTACHERTGAARIERVPESCERCHGEHHGAATRCRLCHTPSPRPAHTRAAHRGCGGSGCHDAEQVAGLAFTRELCLVCHPELADHEPGQECGECHAVRTPAPSLHPSPHPSLRPSLRPAPGSG